MCRDECCCCLLAVRDPELCFVLFILHVNYYPAAQNFNQKEEKSKKKQKPFLKLKNEFLFTVYLYKSAPADKLRGRIRGKKDGAGQQENMDGLRLQ